MVPVRQGQRSIEIKTGERQMNRRRERGSLGRLFRENTKTFLNDILHHVGDDSGFSRPHVGRYAAGMTTVTEAVSLTSL